MKAAVYHTYGGPENILLTEVPEPEVQPDEIKIKVKGASVNRSDVPLLTAKPFIMRFGAGMFKPKKKILGSEFAGEIVEIGSDVQSCKVGDRVFGFNDAGNEAYAEFLIQKEDADFIELPKNTSFQTAAISMEGFHYARNMINKVDLKPGDKVLVNGATGGIGSAAVQLLKYYNAEVFAVGNTEGLDMINRLGADEIMDYRKDDFTKLNRKFRLVLDTVGKSSFKACSSILESDGVYISSELGKNSINILLALWTPWFSKKKVIFPIPYERKQSIILARKLMLEGHYEPVLDRSYRLDQIREAFQYVMTGQKIGNVAIEI